MGKDPAFLFYTDNFQSGTQFFSDMQIGIYIRLLCAQHLHGHLTEKQMIFICKSYDKDIFDKFEKDDAGNFFNARLELEILKRKNYSASRSANKTGKFKEKKPKKKPKSYDNHMGNENEDGNVDTNTDGVEILQFPNFEDFWNEYNYKVGQPKSEKEWSKLSQNEKEAIIQYIPAYIESKPEKKYRKHPETFLRNRGWEDEILNQTKIIPHGKHSQKLADLERFAAETRQQVADAERNNTG